MVPAGRWDGSRVTLRVSPENLKKCSALGRNFPTREGTRTCFGTVDAAPLRVVKVTDRALAVVVEPVAEMVREPCRFEMATSDRTAMRMAATTPIQTHVDGVGTSSGSNGADVGDSAGGWSL